MQLSVWGVLLFLCTCDDVDTGVAYHAHAHWARRDVACRDTLACLEVNTGQVQRRTYHLRARGRQHGVHLGVYRRARAVIAVVMPVPASMAYACVNAVDITAGGTVVASRDDLIVGHDHGAVAAAQARRSGRHGECDIEVILGLTRPRRSTRKHRRPSPRPTARRSRPTRWA